MLILIQTIEDVAGPQAWEAPDYSTFDMSLRYGFKFGTLDTTLTGRMIQCF